MPIFRSNIKSIILLVVFCLSTFLVPGNSYAEDSECQRLIKKKEAKEKEVVRLEAENERIVDTIIDIVETVVGYAEQVKVFFSGSAKDLEEVKDVIEEVNGDLDTAGGLIGKFKKDSEGLLGFNPLSTLLIVHQRSTGDLPPLRFCIRIVMMPTLVSISFEIEHSLVNINL